MAKLFWFVVTIGLVFTNSIYAMYPFNQTQNLSFMDLDLEEVEAHELGNLLLVGLTLIHNAAAKGAGIYYFFYLSVPL